MINFITDALEDRGLLRRPSLAAIDQCRVRSRVSAFTSAAAQKPTGREVRVGPQAVVPGHCRTASGAPGVYFAARASVLETFDGTSGSITMLTWR